MKYKFKIQINIIKNKKINTENIKMIVESDEIQNIKKFMKEYNKNQKTKKFMKKDN